MSIQQSASFALIVLLLVGSAAAQPAFSPQSGVLVLRNGRVLQGQVTRAGDRYLVAVGPHDEVTLPASAVEFFCQDMQQAYLLKREAVRPTAIADLLALAEWCLAHELFPQAAEQLLRAGAVDGQNPRLAVLERRLQVALQQPADPLAPAARPGPAPSTGELQAQLTQLPPLAVEAFTVQVQPLLLNRCAAGRCHGGQGSADFQLVQPAWGLRLPAPMTQQNLFETLKQVDRNSPADSPLLLSAARPHADLATPVFGERDRDKLRLLEAWVQSLRRSAASPTTPELAAAGERGALGEKEAASQDVAAGERRAATSLPTVAQAAFIASAEESSGGSVQASYTLPAGNPPVSPPGPAPAAASQSPPAYRPRDPFDPEIFNQRHFGSHGSWSK
ncbi:MAG: hypothetical protein J5I93_03975 [Pirellulaceae bacterium]|nr:hypothetical protein [Pirellulaceae bacterium]